MEILIFKLVYTEKVMLFDPFGRELLCFEHLDISLDLTRFEKISLQQQILLMKPPIPGRNLSHQFFYVCCCLFSSRCGAPYLLEFTAVEPLL